MERKRTKSIESRTRPDKKTYYIPAATFEEWKFDYILVGCELILYVIVVVFIVGNSFDGYMLKQRRLGLHSFENFSFKPQIPPQTSTDDSKQTKDGASESLPTGWQTVPDKQAGKAY